MELHSRPRPAAVADKPAFLLRLGDNRRYLVDQQGRPFFIMGDTPWFVQKQKIEDVRLFLDDRGAKGFNTVFLELLDDEHIPSIDGYGHHAFQPDTDITKPVEAYWKYAEQVLEEAEKRGLFVVHNSLWFGYGKGLWIHHIRPEQWRVYGAFIAKRFARFKNLMWMHRRAMKSSGPRKLWTAVAERSGDTAFERTTHSRRAPCVPKRRGAALPAAVQKRRAAKAAFQFLTCSQQFKKP